MGTCLLGALGGDLPELHPLYGDEYRSCRTVDCQFLGFLDLPDAR